MKHIVFILCIVAIGFAQSVSAEIPDKIASAFRQVIAIPPVAVVVPTVVELQIETSPYERGTYALYNTTRNEFTPYLIQDSYIENPIPVLIHSEPSTGSVSARALVDNDSETSVDYPLEEGQENAIQFFINANEPFVSSALFFELDRYVALPTTVRISAVVNGVEQVVVAQTPLKDSVVHFPQTYAGNWIVTFTYVQPLRISELHIIQDSVVQTRLRSVRFLAQPGSAYQFYHDADRSVSLPMVESGNLSDERDVFLMNAIPSQQNSVYQESDTDTDGVIDVRDNCVSVSNSDQLDIDKKGRGDVCDDYDRDGLIQSKDNCPNVPNVRQEDTDGDGIGDVCDGEESRITEKYTWIPWVGMGVAAFVLIILFILVATAPKKEEEMKSVE